VGRPEMEEPFLDWAFGPRPSDDDPVDEPEPEAVATASSDLEPSQPAEETVAGRVDQPSAAPAEAHAPAAEDEGLGGFGFGTSSDPTPDLDIAADEPPAAALADEPPAAALADQPPAAALVEEPAVVEPPRELSRFERSLVDEALKKAGLIWVRTSAAPNGRALWYVWTDGCVYVVTGGDEQPDPGLGDGDVVVVVRSKDTMSRLLTVRCVAARVSGDDDDWAAATTELAKGRLNLREAADAPNRWLDAETYAVYRLTPTTEAFDEGPGKYAPQSGRATPVPTQATTAGARPWVLHRRGGSGRPLS
jgi:hypothetical protein